MGGKNTRPSVPPAITDSARENKLIDLALDLVEQQMREGTAPPSLIAHFLKIGTERAKLEMERIKAENNMLESKARALESQARGDQMFQEARRAFTEYSGEHDADD